MSDCCSVKTAPEKAPAVMACPQSGTRSKQVDLLTLKSLVRHLPFGMPAAQYYYCEAPGCDVVYFSSNPEAPLFTCRDLLVRVGAKEGVGPVRVCYCFGISREDIRDEIRLTGMSTVAERIKAEVKAGNCACEVKNPSGKCCLGNVIQALQESLRAVELGADQSLSTGDRLENRGIGATTGKQIGELK